MPDVLLSSIFGELTKQTQVRIDAASELKKRLFDENIYSRYLDWDTPTIGLNFEELIGSYNLSVAAATLDSDGKEPIMGTEGMETIAKKVLNHAISFSMTIEEYRKVLQLLDSKVIDDKAKAQQLVNLMWKSVSNAVKGVESKLDIIFLGALSNEGIFTFNATNNPEGGVKGTIDYKMPSDNKASVTTSWTTGNQATVNCFTDIQEVVNAAADKVKFQKILLSPSKLAYILANGNTKQVIFGTDKKNSPLLLSQLNDFMTANELPVFETVRRTARIQNNGSLVEYSPWNADNMAFLPEGKIGLVKNAYANNELRPEPGVAYSNYGRIRISQWGKGETDNSNGVEFTKAQSLSLPVITEINGIYSLKTIL
nr:major capsid protein [uncultured Draconibacterium sp.]